MENTLDILCRRLEYNFRDRNLLEEAFRHSSFVNESGDPDLRDNERLEFLGDAVLDLAVSHMLMEIHRAAREGDLSKFRAMAVNEASLLRIARRLQLGDCLLLGRGEERTQGRKKPSILANAVEALIGALYLDAGFTRTAEIIQNLFHPLLRDLGRELPNHDYKSLVQEFTQQRYRNRPEYVLVDESGPPHDKTFVIAFRLNGRIVAEASGKSKKSAEQKAAREAYHWLVELENDP